MTPIEQELSLYRRAINEIDDRIEYTTFDRADIYRIIAKLTAGLAELYGTQPAYRLTEAGRAMLRDAQQGVE